MNRYVGFAAALVLAAWLGATPAPAQHKADHFDACAKVCAECQTACDKNFQHCFHFVLEGQKGHARCARLCGDCAELCGTAARLSARKGELAVPACEACARACDTCAAECERFKDDKDIQECAKKCRECAEACRDMIKHVGPKAK